MMFVCFPLFMVAQTGTENEKDSILNDNDQLIQVAFRKVPFSNIMGGVSVINMEELTKKNYTNYSLDLEGFIGGWNGSSLWGMDDLLVLVDGIPRDANNILPSEIEQITFLKGASAVVLYGSTAAKGVIYITTKRGKDEPFKVSVRANTGFNVSKSYPKYLSSAEYLTLYREALVNDGVDITTKNMQDQYGDEVIQHFASGDNPYRYPDVDLYSSEYIKKAYNRSDVTTEISGGNEKAAFYTNIGYYRQDDVFKFGEAKNNYIDRLNIHGNIDVEVNKNIHAFVNANATFYNSRNARSTSGGNYWGAASSLRPNRFAPLVPISYINDSTALAKVQNSSNIIDGKYFLSGTQSDQTNIFADYYAAGYSKWISRQFQFDTRLDFDLSDAVKGLSFHTQFAVDYATSYSISYENSYAVYSPTWGTNNGEDVITALPDFGVDKKDGVQHISGSSDRQTIAFSGYFTYENSINDAHNFYAMLIANGYQQTYSGVYHKPSNANLGLQLAYNFKGRYFADFSAAEVHTAKLAEGHRNAFSPSFTLGWKLSEENFLANSSIVDDLVLSGSTSILNTDLDISEYYMYEARYTQADPAPWWGWYDGAVEHSTISLSGSNEDLTFIKRRELSANLRTSLWNRMITADVSYFVNTMEGLITTPTLFPDYFVTGYPQTDFTTKINYNNDKRTGFDFNVNLNKRISGIDFSLGVAGTYFTTEATKRSELVDYDYQKSQGRPIDGIWGLESAGFFQSQEEIDDSPKQVFGGTIKPGDIKYIDQNGDSIIDTYDQVFLKRGGWYGAPFTMGVNLTVKWKNLTFFAVGTGYFGAYGIKGGSYYWVYGDGKYSDVVRDRWTEETKETATYPRLTTKTGANNFRNSDFWLIKTDYFNLAKVQVTYDIPKNLLQKFFLHDISIYMSGNNLLLISKEREALEMNVGYAPQTRFYNIGVKAFF